jgi:hypothetical protein
LKEIARQLGIEPSHQPREGERSRLRSRSYATDAWHLTAAIPEERDLSNHLRELWRIVATHVAYIRSLDAEVDVFCGYRSDHGASGFNIDPDALTIFTALDVPVAISVIVDSWLEHLATEPTIQ